MEIDIDTLNKIEQLVKDANCVQVIAAPGEPAHVYYLREGNMVRRVEADSPVIGHTASTLDTLADKAKDTLADDGNDATTDAQIWVDRTGVVLLLDDERRNKVLYTLSLSEQMVKLQNVAQIAFTQRDLILMLRTTFRDSIGQAGDLIGILRTVKFNAQQQGEQTVQHGKASLGKSIMAEVTGTGNLPEYVTFSVPVFAQAGVQSVRANVECALEPDAGTQTFKLIPLSGAIERAIGDGEGQIAVRIHGLLDERKANGVGVFMGRP